ncbi:MAG: hypothetical protein ACE15E_07000 [Acidobacteriota bacterium]
MDINDFLNQPTSRLHPSYKQSLLTVEAAEYATGEVLLGSVCRKLLLDLGEATIDLSKLPELEDQLDRAFADIDPGLAGLGQTLLFEPGGIASPQKYGQLGLRPLRSLMPIVPQVARHACVIGKVRSRWSPANLLVQVIGTGLNEQKGNELIDRLTRALLIGPDEDLFARFLATFLERAAGSGNLPSAAPYRLTADDRRGFRGQAAAPGLSPAERVCQDLDAVVAIKGQLTRRQWSVLLEAACRIGLVTHVLWVCQANAACWQLALEAAEGAPVPDVAEVERRLWVAHRDSAPLIEIGRPATPGIKRILERYLVARFGLNILLCALDGAGQTFAGALGADVARGTSAAEGIREFLLHVAANRWNLNAQNPAGWLRALCSEVCDEYPSHVSAKTGSTKNLLEFAIYALGQLKTSPPDRRCYDQAFLLSSDERSNRKPQVAQPGPAMLLFLAHACCSTLSGLPVSLEDFRLYLSDYGLHTPAGELLTGRLCSDLQNLGLVVDSPDAAGGRLLVKPF